MDKIFWVCILVALVGTASMTAFHDALNNIDGFCQKNSAPVTTPCTTDKSAVENPFQNNDLAGACTNLPAYKTCLGGACDPGTDLSNSIATMETTCGLSSSVMDFMGVLNIIDNKCAKNSAPVTDPCATDKNEVDTQLQSDSLTEACKKLPGYKTCLLSSCDTTTDLTASINTMEKTCGMSVNPSVTDFLGLLNIIDNQCAKNSAPVPDPCAIEKNEVDTHLQGDSLKEACKKLPEYKSCLLTDCDKTTDLTKSIDAMEEKCGSGFMKISVSMLTLFLTAIINFL